MRRDNRQNEILYNDILACCFRHLIWYCKIHCGILVFLSCVSVVYYAPKHVTLLLCSFALYYPKLPCVLLVLV